MEGEVGFRLGVDRGGEVAADSDEVINIKEERERGNIRKNRKNHVQVPQREGNKERPRAAAVQKETRRRQHSRHIETAEEMRRDETRTKMDTEKGQKRKKTDSIHSRRRVNRKWGREKGEKKFQNKENLLTRETGKTIFENITLEPLMVHLGRENPRVKQIGTSARPTVRNHSHRKPSCLGQPCAPPTQQE